MPTHSVAAVVIVVSRRHHRMMMCSRGTVLSVMLGNLADGVSQHSTNSSMSVPHTVPSTSGKVCCETEEISRGDFLKLLPMAAYLSCRRIYIYIYIYIYTRTYVYVFYIYIYVCV